MWPLPGKRASTKPYSSSQVFHSDLGYASGVRNGFASLHLLACVRVVCVRCVASRWWVGAYLGHWLMVLAMYSKVSVQHETKWHMLVMTFWPLAIRVASTCVRVCVEIFADREERDIVLVRDWCEIQRGGGGNKNANSMRGASERVVVVLVAGAPRTTTS